MNFNHYIRLGFVVVLVRPDVNQDYVGKLLSRTVGMEPVEGEIELIYRPRHSIILIDYLTLLRFRFLLLLLWNFVLVE